MAGSHSRIDHVDAHLDTLFKTRLSSTPYIQRIRQSADRPVQTPKQTDYWAKGTLFSESEHDLQYLTFRRDMDGIIESLGSWDDGNGSILQATPPDDPSSTTGTPRLGPMKTIPFAQWSARNKKLQKGAEKNASPVSQLPIGTGTSRPVKRRMKTDYSCTEGFRYCQLRSQVRQGADCQ